MKHILTCCVVILLGCGALAQGRGEGHARGRWNKFLDGKKNAEHPEHAGPDNAKGTGPPGLSKKLKAPGQPMSWEERRNSIMQKMETRAQQLGTKLGASQPAALEAPLTDVSWGERREQILAKLKARQAELVAKIELDRAILEEKRRLAAQNIVDNKPIMDGADVIVSGAVETPKTELVNKQDVTRSQQGTEPQPHVPDHSVVSGFHVNDLPVIDLADPKDPWAQLGNTSAEVGLPAMMTPMSPSGEDPLKHVGNAGIPLDPAGNPAIPLGSADVSPLIPPGPDPTSGTLLGSIDTAEPSEKGILLGPEGGIPLGTPGSGQSAVLQDIDISKFFSTGEIVPVSHNQPSPGSNNQAVPRSGATQGIQTVSGEVMPTIERPNTNRNSGTRKPTASLLGFVSDISRALRNNG